jgi:hypothetical protein
VESVATSRPAVLRAPGPFGIYAFAPPSTVSVEPVY